MENDKNIWNPIKFDEKWNKTDTSKLDDILPSWHHKRKILESNPNECAEFLDRLKRQHAIETGIIEGLYDLKRGITETFIEKGFRESYLQHNDTNIPDSKLMDYLSDHSDAIDLIFDVVKEKIPVSVHLIHELHQLITRNQSHCEAINSLGEKVNVPLLKGKFKEKENNPRRSNGTKFIYCPPLQVESEMDNLIEIYNELEKNNIPPIIISAWFHHSFTIIHPYQDGNGRLVRLLASLILIKHNLFPFTVERTERTRYIKSLEEADNGEPNNLVIFFSELQKRNIEIALNRKTTVSIKPIKYIASALFEKVEESKKAQRTHRTKLLNRRRNIIFDFCTEIAEEVYEELREKIPKETAGIYLKVTKPNSEEQNYFFTHQIIEYAKKHDYFFNRSLPRGWFKISVILFQTRKYEIVISVHHYGYDDTTIVIGAFIQSIYRKISENIETDLPVEIKPHTISLEANKENIERIKENLQNFVRDTFAIALTQIMSEIT